MFDGADIAGRSGLIDGGAGFDAFSVTGAATVNTEGARVTGVEAVVVASTDTAAQTVIVNLDELAAESNNGAGADANVFLALLGGGSDTLDFTGTGWTLTASLPMSTPGTTLPDGAVLLGAAEAAVSTPSGAVRRSTRRPASARPSASTSTCSPRARRSSPCGRTPKP